MNVCMCTYMGASQNKGYHFGGPSNKDLTRTYLGSILGSPYFGKLPLNPKPYTDSNLPKQVCIELGTNNLDALNKKVARRFRGKIRYSILIEEI